MKDNDILAFPRQHVLADANAADFKQGCDGMTLRDYFAAKAMNAMICDAGLMRNTAIDADNISGAAYEIADAMLEARAK
jgi:hypothetical protein